MATATERKFTSLRKRLDQLGYRQPLGVESLPLVDKLFGDLLHTTESLKQTKQQLGKHKEEKTVWEQHVEPYQTDNARVIKENNELHQRIIRMKESAELKTTQLKAILRRMEHENADLKFLNTQYLQRIRAQEKESERKTEKILELQEKNFQAVIETPGGRKKNIPFRRQRMQIDCEVPESAKSGPGGGVQLPAPDPYVADLLQVADQRMAQLQSLVEQGVQEKEKLQESLQSMRKLVENREAEIERLTLMLKGGRPAEALAAEGIRQSRERMVAHLNIQVDFLQNATRELEGKLAESEQCKAGLETRVKELSAKNARICSELEEIGQLVKQTEQERAESEECLQRRISELEAEQARSLAAKEELSREIERMQQEKAELLGDNQDIAQLLANTEGDRKEVGNLLERLSEERKNFQRQCKQFQDREAVLQQQIADLERHNGHASSPTAEVRRLRKERDDLRDAVRNFETELSEIQMDTKLLAEDRDNFKLLYEQVSEELGRSRERARAPLGSGAAVLRRIEGERDHALLELQQKKTECRSLQDRLKGLQDTQQHDLSSLEDKVAELRVQLQEMCTERDELSERLTGAKKVMTSMQQELESSTQSLSSAHSELARHRGRATQLQALVDASERTRQEQQKGIRTQSADVQAAQSTVTSLKNKIAQLSHEVSEREEKIAELRHALTMLDQDHDQLVGEANKKDEAVATLNTRLQQRETRLEELQSQLAQLRTELGQAVGSGKEKEAEVSQVHRDLDITKTELASTRLQVDTLTQQVSELRSDLNTMAQENQSVSGQLQHVLEEKSSLDVKLQEYAQSLLSYEETVSLKDQERSELINSYNDLNSQTERLNDTLQKMEGSLSATKMELMAVSQEKHHVEGMAREQATEIQTLRQYEQQLSTMSHSLSKMESALRQEQSEKKALLADLEATRELCVQYDRTKESLSTQLSTQSLHYDQLQSQLGDMRAERDLLNAQLRSEQSTLEQLQTLISAEREKEFHSHMVGKEREEEVRHLREQLARLEADRMVLADQTRKLRADTAVQSESLERLKTELASEKFQKAHMKQQLDAQRCSLSMLTSPTLHANPRTPSPAREGSTSPPKPDLPCEPVIASPTSTPSLQQDSHSSQEEEMFSRERQTLASQSARLVDQLLQTPSSPPIVSSSGLQPLTGSSQSIN